MKKKICFILFILLLFTCSFVYADTSLLTPASDASCPELWSQTKPTITDIAKGQVVASNDIVTGVEAEHYWYYHLNVPTDILYARTYYDVNYYIATKDSDGNIVYEKYALKENYCTYNSYNTYLYLSQIEIDDSSYSKDTWLFYGDHRLILPTVNGKSVKWRYVSSQENTYTEYDTEPLLNEYSKRKNYDVLIEDIKKLNESNIYKLKIYDAYKNNEINFYEVVDEEANLNITCNNQEENKYNCSLSLDYDYIPQKIKISLSEEKVKLNDFEVKGAWLVTEESNHKILEYTSNKVEYEFSDGKEIATFTISYEGENPQEYIKSNINAQTIEITNNIGAFADDQIVNNVKYLANKNTFNNKTISNPETLKDTFMYGSLIILIIILSIILIVLKNGKLKTFNKL